MTPLRLCLAALLVLAALLPPAWAACTNTAWLSLCKPAIGDTTWGTDWNTNADKVDDAVSGVTEIRPRVKVYTNAGRPAAATNGRLIIVSDTGLQGLWRDTGTAWVRLTPQQVLTATASLDFGAFGANACQTLTLTVTGAADGDAVVLGVPNALASLAGVTFSGWVSAANTVSVRGCNATGTATSDPAAATVRAWVLQP